MATQNLLQRFDTAEDTTGSSSNVSDRRIIEVFIASESITAKDAVALDMSQTTDADKALKVVQCTDNNTDKLFVGVALESATAGQTVKVVIRGFVEANVAGATVEGSYLQAGATAGRLSVHSTSTYSGTKICAVSTEEDDGNVATVYVFPQF